MADGNENIVALDASLSEIAKRVINDLTEEEDEGQDSSGPANFDASSHHANDSPNNQEPFQTLAEMTDVSEAGRPNYHWWTIIRACILEAPTKRLNLAEIYDSVCQRWPFFLADEETWKVSLTVF